MAGLGTFSNGGLGMGIAFSLYDDFSQTAGDIENSMNRLGLNSEQLINRVNASMNMMATGAGMVAAGVGLLAPIGYGLKIAGEFEQARIGLFTFLKDYQLVDEVMETIKTDAALTPFGTQEILAANRALISAGLSAEAARKDALNLANAISAVGAGAPELARMALNMQGIKGTGQATSQDLKQFGILGINVYKLLADATGKTEAEAREMKLTYEDLSLALAHAAGEGGAFFNAMANQSESINGKISTLMDYIQFAFADLGNAVLPIFHQVIDAVTDAVKAVSAFTKTQLGQWITRVVAVTGVLLILFGTLLLTVGFLRFSMYKLAGAFGDVTKAEILSTIASNGVIAGFRRMAVAAWSSLGPYVAIVAVVVAAVAVFYKLGQMLDSNSIKTRQWAYAILFILGPIGWLIGGIMAIRQGMKDFNDLMEGTGSPLTGLAGVFQKLGGIIKAVIQIFSSYNAKDGTFTLPVQMEDALLKAGILELVISIGTYIARLMAFWEGFKTGLQEAYDTITGIILGIVNAFTPAAEKFKSWDDWLSRSTSSMESWKEAGRIAGIVIVTALFGIASMMLFIGIVMAAVAVVIVAALAIIIAPFYALYRAVTYVIEKFREFREAGSGVIVSLVATIFSGVNELVSAIVTPAINLGKSIVMGIVEGIKGAWSLVVDAMKLMLLDSPIGGLLNATGLISLEPSGVQSNNTGGRVLQPAPSITMDGYNSTRAQAAQMQYNSFYPNIAQNKQANNNNPAPQQPQPINIYMDSDLIHKGIVDKQEKNNARK